MTAEHLPPSSLWLGPISGQTKRAGPSSGPAPLADSLACVRGVASLGEHSEPSELLSKRPHAPPPFGTETVGTSPP